MHYCIFRDAQCVRLLRRFNRCVQIPELQASLPFFYVDLSPLISFSISAHQNSDLRSVRLVIVVDMILIVILKIILKQNMNAVTATLQGQTNRLL